ncbi:MAG: hypothetical protein QOE20_5241, partial [Mycobacterium sp.]|nr:hypothetical protein [Mycobacterium sp.]
FMEFHLRRRVAALANVTVFDNHEAVEPVMAADTVTGARIINHDNGITITVNADLVVDATGRAARTPAFLESHGFGAPPEERIPSIGGYSSQLMRIPPGRITERLAFVNQGSRAPGALLVAYEHDTWMLAIARPAEEGNPPSDFTEMLAAAEQMLPATITAGLRDATPIGEISISRSTAAAWRRYDRMPRLPAGLLVLGDAVCNLNPLYGQGMTMAALQAFALRDCLRAGNTDLPRRFYLAAAGNIGPVWAVNRANDRAPSGSATRTPQQRLRSWTQHAALKAATHDIAVAERILRVRGLIDPPTRLQDPALFARILLANLRHPSKNPHVVVDQQSHSSSVNPADDHAIRTLDRSPGHGLGHRRPRRLRQCIHCRCGLRHLPRQPAQRPRSDRHVVRAAVQETATWNAVANPNHPSAVSDARRGADPGTSRRNPAGPQMESPPRARQHQHRGAHRRWMAVGRLAEHHTSPARRKAVGRTDLPAIPGVRQDGRNA